VRLVLGTADALDEARAALGDEVRWEVAMGGLVTGARVRPVAHDAAYLTAGLQRVAEVTGRHAGAAFTERILGPGTWVADSEPPCRAILVAEELGGVDAALAVCRGLSDALYVHGREPDRAEVIASVVTDAGLDSAALVTRWQEPAARERLQGRWAAGRASGLQSYPTLAVRAGPALVPVVVGYAAADVIARRVRAVLSGGGA